MFEINIRLWVYQEPEHILLNQNNPKQQVNIPQRKHESFLYDYLGNTEKINKKQYVKTLQIQIHAYTRG